MENEAMTSRPTVRSRRGRRGLGVALLVIVFLSGALCGAAAFRLFARPRTIRQVSVRVAPRGVAVYEELGLSPVQRQQIDSVLKSIQPRTDSLLGAALPQLKALIHSADSAIRSSLTPAQRPRLDSLERARSSVISP